MKTACMAYAHESVSLYAFFAGTSRAVPGSSDGFCLCGSLIVDGLLCRGVFVHKVQSPG